MKLLICTQVVDKNHPILGFFHRWIEEFAKHFDEVYVICLEKGEYALPSHVHVYSLGKEEGENKLKYILRFYKYFGRIFFRVKVDFVFLHMGAIYNIVASPFFLVRRLYKTKFYWWKAHGHLNLQAKLALLFADRVYTSTESGFSIATDKKRVIGQAIDTDLFTLPNEGFSRKKEIIFVGRITPVKHIEDFIECAALLRSDLPDWQFTIVGPIGDESYFALLQQKVTELHLEDRVTFAGAKKHHELVSLYQNASFFLNTSLTHSMDKTVLEALLCGCLPITANRAFQDLLQPEGLYVHDASPSQYVDAVHTLLEKPDLDEQRKRLRERVTSLHSISTFSSRIFSI
jgi:glycosyltransferase involved in cell wall biosynthesis